MKTFESINKKLTWSNVMYDHAFAVLRELMSAITAGITISFLDLSFESAPCTRSVKFECVYAGKFKIEDVRSSELTVAVERTKTRSPMFYLFFGTLIDLAAGRTYYWKSLNQWRDIGRRLTFLAFPIASRRTVDGSLFSWMEPLATMRTISNWKIGFLLGGFNSTAFVSTS